MRLSKFGEPNANADPSPVQMNTTAGMEWYFPLLKGGWLEFELAEIAPSPLIFHSCCRCSPALSIYLWKGSFRAGLPFPLQYKLLQSSRARFTETLELNLKIIHNTAGDREG